MARLAPLLLAGLCLAPVRLLAAQAGDLGLGGVVGDPTGATAKYFLSPRQSLSAGVGVSETLTLFADSTWHAWNVLPQPKRGELGLYASLGGRLEMQKHTDFGIRTLAGLSYWPRLKRKAEFFLELGPVFRVAPDARVRIDGGFGLRVYLGRRE